MSDRKEQGNKEASRRRESAGMWSVMYPVHFGMHENPFPSDADPKFLWLGGKRKEIPETLVRGILSGEGVQVVIGNPGTGKTPMAHAVLGGLGDQVLSAVVPCAEYKGIDFLRLVERAYGISGKGQNQDSFFSRFSEFAHRSRASGKKVVLIVDDAHRLSPPYLQELSELSRIEEGGARLLSLVFFGEPRLLDLLKADPNPDFSESANRSMALDALTREETTEYIQHHLRVARCEKELFEPGAVDEIFAYSHGIPRLIDRACDAALSRAYYVGEKLVTPNTVKDALDLMPTETTALPESVPDFSLEDAAADRERDGESDEEDEPGMPARYARRQKRNWIAYAVLGCLVVAAGGVAIYVMKSPGSKAPAIVAEKKQEASEAKPAVRGTVTPPEGTNRTAEMPAQQPVVTAEEKAPKGREVRAVRKKTRETVASRPTAGRARQAPAASPTREAVTPERVSPGSDAGRGTSADGGESASREPARQGTEQVESGEVIDWMLKKRSGQR